MADGIGLAIVDCVRCGLTNGFDLVGIEAGDTVTCFCGQPLPIATFFRSSSGPTKQDSKETIWLTA